MDPEYWAKWHEIFTHNKTINYFTATTATIWVEEQEVAKEAMKELPLPILFIEAEKEDVVSNEHIKQVAATAPNPRGQNGYVTIPECDHSLTCFDATYASSVIKHTIKHFDAIVREREAKRAARTLLNTRDGKI